MTDWAKKAKEADDRWKKRSAEAVQRWSGGGKSSPRAGIRLGENLSGGAEVRLPMKELATHMHVVGSTGVGKSFFLEGMIKSLIAKGHGVCVIDPTGDLYDRVLQYCAHLNVEHPKLGLSKRVIPFDIAERKQILGFNPIQRNAKVKIYQVVALMEAIRKCWGQDSFQETPRLARWLFNTVLSVVDSGMTFLQMQYMVMSQANAHRDAIVRRISDPNIQAEWESLARKTEEKREGYVESCLNRVRPFVTHEIIRRVVGQQTNTIDFDDVLENNKIFLVNLARQNTIARDQQHLLGTLFVNELLTSAFARRPGKRNPFYLFIDEFSHFVTKDICEILDGGRKFGLHLILAHQHLNQLKLKDEDVYYSVMGNARTKVVFGGMIDEDLEVMGKEIFELDPDEIKQEIWQTKFRPVESTRRIVTTSEAEITHTSLAHTTIPGSDAWADDVVTETEGDSSSSTSSSSESLVPYTEQHEFSELSSREFRSLAEQLYIKKAQLKRQPTQHAAILVPGENVVMVKVPTLRDFPVKGQALEEFKESCFENAGCFKTPAAADAEIQALDDSLLLGKSPIDAEFTAKDDDDDDYE